MQEIPCAYCRGTGISPRIPANSSAEHQCYHCRGTGKLKLDIDVGVVLYGDNSSFSVTEYVDGHLWGHVYPDVVKHECCLYCGMVRRSDKQNQPCKGQSTVRLR